MFILLNLFYLPPFYHDTFTINILTLGAALGVPLQIGYTPQSELN